MAYQGHFENGVVVFDEPVDLPEGATVLVERYPVDGQGWESAENEDKEWSEFSLRSALRGMEGEEFPYTLADLKDTFR
jgi:hypothetical protein